MEPKSKNRAMEIGNLAVIAAMCLLWISPTLQFWGAAFGPLRPFSYSQADVAPSPAWFIVGLAVCFTPLALPKAYYGCWEGRRAVRIYEMLSVRVFKRFATNGDIINRWARRSDPLHRIVRDRASAREFAAGTAITEKSHLVLLAMGLFTSAYAVRIGWDRWAIGLTAGNVAFNLYPILLQRYNRHRLARLAPRWHAADGPGRSQRSRPHEQDGRDRP